MKLINWHDNHLEHCGVLVEPADLAGVDVDQPHCVQVLETALPIAQADGQELYDSLKFRRKTKNLAMIRAGIFSNFLSFVIAGFR